MKKQLILFVTLVFLGVGLTGCINGESAPIVGSWVSTSGSFYFDYPKTSGYGKLFVDVLEFSSDGTVKVYSSDGRVEKGTWTSTKEQSSYGLVLRMEISDGYYSPHSAKYFEYMYTYTMPDDNTLVIKHGFGKTATFSRQ